MLCEKENKAHYLICLTFKITFKFIKFKSNCPDPSKGILGIFIKMPFINYYVVWVLIEYFIM